MRISGWLLVLSACVWGQALQDERWFGDPEAGFAFELPEGAWEWVPGDGARVFRQLATGRRVALDREPLRTRLTAFDYARLVADEMRGQLPGADVTVVAETLGVFAARLSFRGVLDGQPRAMDQWMCLAADGSAMWVLTFSGPPADAFVGWRAARKGVLGSFRLGDPGELLAAGVPPQASVRADASLWSAQGELALGAYHNSALGVRCAPGEAWQLELQSEGSILLAGADAEAEQGFVLSAELLPAPQELDAYLQLVKPRLESALLTAVEAPRIEQGWGLLSYQVGEQQLVQCIRVSPRRSAALVLSLSGAKGSETVLLERAAGLRASLELEGWE